MAKKKSHNHKSDKKDNSNTWKIGAAVFILLALVLLLVFYDRLFPAIEPENVAAVVNGEKITEKELDQLYSRVPETYRMIGITREKFLTETIVPQKLLVQEAAKRGISASEEEVISMVNEIIELGGVTEDEFIQQLEEQNMTLDEFKLLAEEQIIITKLMNQSLSEMEIADNEVKDFYAKNKELFTTGNETYQPYSDVKDDIKSYLANQKFMQELKDNADIQILLGQGASSGAANTQPGKSFRSIDEEICMEDGKPLVILFSTTTCPHCRWIKQTFDSMAKEYGDTIAAYHWEMDTGDNTLTPEPETKVPDTYLKMFWEKSEQGGVPTYVFGCKYYRIGNAFEQANDLAAEERDFKAVIDMLLKA
ncbi:MAG: SurA N-terminal domain-containing protein [Nanoarchaeota archaeon]|nr:SurA N-terminal domain-containing protein [Nanoarchaeota archaeon]